MSKTYNRLYYADVLRTLAIIAVIVLHNSADSVGEYGHISTVNWLTAVFFNGITRFCVPLFVALSGSLLLTKAPEPITVLFKKRLPKLLVPLIIWSAVYYAADIFFFHQVKDHNILNILQQAYRGPLVFHFWFLYMMIGIYLLYPIIRVFLISATEVHIQYFLIIWFVINCVIGMTEVIFQVPIGIDLSFFTGYVGYFVLGYYISTANFSAKHKPAYVYLLAGSMAISILMILLLYLFKVKSANDAVESDFTPELPFIIIGLFLTVKYSVALIPKNLLLRKGVTAISTESYGIYIIHVLVMRMLDNFGLWKNLVVNSALIIVVPAATIVILGLSFLCVKLIRLIPLSSYII